MIASMRNVSFGYADVPCLVDVNLDVDAGEFVAIVGPNGAAKTTLLKLMLGLFKPWQGTVERSNNGAAGKLRIGYVPQQIAAFNSGFPSNIWEFVRSGSQTGGYWFRRLTSKDDARAEAVLREVGMWELRRRRIGELSGGQKQRICIARALAGEPDLLVLDEPATGMDADSRLGFHRLMAHHAHERGRTVVMVTHNPEEASPFLDRIVHLERKENGGWKCCTTTSCSGHFAPVE